MHISWINKIWDQAMGFYECTKPTCNKVNHTKLDLKPYIYKYKEKGGLKQLIHT
jgi:hypothetical protein